MKKLDLQQWDVCDPQNRQDHLPQPYALIADTIKQTILYKLDLAMFQIEQKKKDSNYEGSVKDYYSQNSIQISNVACISSTTNQHNHLLAGDKNGTLFLLDLAKKVVFSKKDLSLGHRVVHISESLVSDGEVTITTVAVVLNSHPKVYILRYRHGQQKLIITHQICVAEGVTNPGKLPYACQWQEYSRLLCVFTYDGTILMYRLPELALDLDSINRTQSIPLEEEEFKKRLRYPLNYAQIQSQCSTIKDPILSLSFPGKKVRKVNSQGKSQFVQQSNPSVDVRQVELQNGLDNTPAYRQPLYQPYLYVVYTKLQLAKKKQFQRGRFIDIAERVIYGWTNTKTFNVAHLLLAKDNYYPEYIHVQHFLQRMPEQFTKDKTEYLLQPITLRHVKTIKTIYEVTATALSQPDQIYLATGMSNGTTSVWSTNAFNILLNTRKHQGSVSSLHFFQSWKLISGSSKGEVNIDNLIEKRNQVSRTNTFQSKVDYPIIDIRVSPLGVAFVLDGNSNLRTYDLWRNQKIAKVQSCNNFAIMDNKGKRWLGTCNAPAATLYTNNDFTAVLSTNWPNYTPRQLEDSETKKKQVGQLLENPWKCRGTNLHVLRNFQFMLSLFEGIQTIYKKGYDRKKVQNLFSNLQFAQLYDRNFDIPDFGVSAHPFKKGNQTRFNQSSKSHTSSKSREKLMKESSSGVSQSKYPLTNEVLHPQKFLFERRKIRVSEVLTDERLKGKILDDYKRQSALESALQNTLSKGLL